MFDIPVTPKILKKISEIDRLRGSWGSTATAPPDALGRLRSAARVESVAASSRLAGIRVSEPEVEAVLADPGAAHRERETILGLAAAFDWQIPSGGGLLDPESLGRLNAIIGGDLSRDPAPAGWRRQHLSREAFSSEGTALGRVFPTLPPRMIAQKMDEVLGWYEIRSRDGDHHPLLVVGSFLLAFLAACPFERGNGRTGRVLSSRLAERCGYPHVRYASFDRVLEETRELYYEAFDASETRLWTGEADLEPWLDYYLEAMLEQARRAQRAVTLENQALRLSPLQQQVLRTLRRHGTADASLLLAATGANRHTLKDNMRRLVGMGLVDKTGQRRATRYRLGQGAAARGLQLGPDASGGH